MGTYSFLSGNVAVFVDFFTTAVSRITNLGPVQKNWPLTFRNLSQKGDSTKGIKSFV